MRDSLSLTNSSRLIHYLILISAFVVPFTLGSSQIITGILVNTALTVSALRLGKEARLSWIILPSLAVLTRGLVFGPMTPYLYYFLPLIWFSNWSFISILSSQNRIWQIFSPASSGVGLVFRPVQFLVAAGVKVLILYGAAQVLVSLKIVPSIFLSSMGVIQIMTLVGGGVGAYFILHLWTLNRKK